MGITNHKNIGLVYSWIALICRQVQYITPIIARANCTISTGLTFPNPNELLGDYYDAVFCCIVNPCGHLKYRTNVAKIVFKGQDLPEEVYRQLSIYTSLVYVFLK